MKTSNFLFTMSAPGPCADENPYHIVPQSVTDQSIVKQDSSEKAALYLMIAGIFFPPVVCINVCLHIRSPSPTARLVAIVSLMTMFMYIIGIGIFYYWLINAMRES